jgi:hypothetical protein
MSTATPEYVWEKFYSAVRALASGDVPLRERLEWAWDQLQRLDVEDFPEGQNRARFKEVHEQLSHMGGGSESLSDEDADIVAETIVSLYDDVARQLGPMG